MIIVVFAVFFNLRPCFDHGIDQHRGGEMGLGGGKRKKGGEGGRNGAGASV